MDGRRRPAAAEAVVVGDTDVIDLATFEAGNPAAAVHGAAVQQASALVHNTGRVGAGKA